MSKGNPGKPKQHGLSGHGIGSEKSFGAKLHPTVSQQIRAAITDERMAQKDYKRLAQDISKMPKTEARDLMVTTATQIGKQEGTHEQWLEELKKIEDKKTEWNQPRK